MALPPPFSSKSHDVTLVNELWLQEAIKHISKDPKFANAACVIADMAGIPAYAGWNLKSPRFSGSVLKLAAMFAAFQLRENLKLAAASLKKDEIFKKVKVEWAPLVEKAVAGPKNFPHLDTIFTPSDGTVEFTSAFEADLNLMISKSDTHASGRIIDKLGHQYINGALAMEQLYSEKDSGMWLGGDYNQIEWKAEAISKSHMAATPLALLRFLTLLHTKKLVNEPASRQMRQMMNNFYTTRVLDRKTEEQGKQVYDKDKSYGKLGWEFVGKTKRYFDAGVVDRKTSKGSFQYIIVILGLHWSEFVQLDYLLDSAIVKWFEDH